MAEMNFQESSHQYQKTTSIRPPQLSLLLPQLSKCMKFDEKSDEPKTPVEEVPKKCPDAPKRPLSNSRGTTFYIPSSLPEQEQQALLRDITQLRKTLF